MADNEHEVPGQPGPPPAAPDPGDAPTPPSGELIMPPTPPPDPSPPPAPREPTVIDPEQVREFQQFQQFQELMRQQRDRGFPQGEPPPPGFLQPWGPQQPRRGPIRRALGAAVSKIVTAVVVVLLLIGAGWFAIDYFFGGPPSQAPASQIGGNKTKDRLLFEKNPRSAVRRVYENIAMGDQRGTCDRFTPQARTQFTNAFGGDSCETVVDTLKAQVTEGMKDEYANPWIPASAATPTGQTATVSSCDLDVEGGPRLGRFTLGVIEESLDGQWIVTAYEQETCSGEPASPPTS